MYVLIQCHVVFHSRRIIYEQAPAVNQRPPDDDIMGQLKWDLAEAKRNEDFGKSNEIFPSIPTL